MKTFKIKDVCHLEKGQQIDTSLLNDIHPYKYINGGMKESGYYTLYNTEGETVLVSEGGASCGYVNYINERFWCGCHCYKLTECKILPKYLYYALKGNQNKLMALRTGSAMPNIKKASLQEMKLKINENFLEQKDTVKKLDLLQSIITHRRQQLAKLDELVKARFIEMFGDTILNPLDWKKDLLGTVCDVRDGTHDSPQYYESGYPLVTSKNVTGGKIDLTDCSLISELDFKKINERSKVDIGDIIMPMIGTVGKPVIVEIEPNFAIKNVSLIKFKSNSRVLNKYICALLQSDYFNDTVLRKVRGGTQKFISLDDIRKLEVLVPPMELQKQFTVFIEQVDKFKFVVQKSLDQAQLLFDSLMQKYFG